MKGQKELEEWAATYGDDKEDIRASMYDADLMIEFAKYYHKEQLILSGVSQQRELLIGYNKYLEDYCDTHYIDTDTVENYLKTN